MPKPPPPRESRARLSWIGNLSWAAIETAGGWAETSERLSQADRDELIRLRKKARNRRTPLSRGERAKYASLVVRAVGIERLRKWLDRQPERPPESPREIRDIDAAERLERAAKLRDDGVISDEDFLMLKVRYLEEL